MLTLTDSQGRNYVMSFDIPGKILLLRNARPLRLFAVSIARWTRDGHFFYRVNIPKFAQLERELESVFHHITGVTCEKGLIPGEFSIKFDPSIRILGYEDVRHIDFFF